MSCEGLIAAIIFEDINNNSDYSFVSEICEKCMQRGLLVVHTGRESIKLGPPLIISEAALIEGLEVLTGAIREVTG